MVAVVSGVLEFRADTSGPDHLDSSTGLAAVGHPVWMVVAVHLAMAHLVRSRLANPARRGHALHAASARWGHDVVETQIHGHLPVDIPRVPDHEIHEPHAS